MDIYTQAVAAYRRGDEDELGGFMSALLNAFGRADSNNFERLALGFPGLAAAFKEGGE